MSASTRLARLVELMRMEARGDRSGGHAVFDALSPVLFTLALRAASASNQPQ
jgi:AraC family transcriptional activator of mtrCDE